MAKYKHLSALLSKPPILESYVGARERAKLGAKTRTNQLCAKATVITAVYNGASSIKATFDAIRKQSYPNIEYVVVDGGSTDGTLDIIKQNLDIIDLWLSEADAGIYDAFNKGVAISTGEYISFLNSDDTVGDHHIATAVSTLQSTSRLWVFGDCWLHNYYGRDVFLAGDSNYEQVISFNMPSIQQVTVVVHRYAFLLIGLFNIKYRIASDYDWFVRLAKHRIKAQYSPGLVGHMLAGGVSTTRQKLAIWESFMVSVKNGHPVVDACVFWWMRLKFYRDSAPDTYQRTNFVMRRTLSKIFMYKIRQLISSQSSMTSEIRKPVDASKTKAAFLEARDYSSSLNESALLYLINLLQGASSYSVISSSETAFQIEAIGSRLGVTSLHPGKSEILFVDDLTTLSDAHAISATHIVILQANESLSLPKEWRAIGAAHGLLLLKREGTA